MATDFNNPMLQAALWYANLGYPVFPCTPGQKTPLTQHGLLNATTDAEQIERWWTEHPDANIAIRTDGLVAIDIDGVDNPWLANEPDKLAELARAPTSLTPRGGRHCFFRQPEGHAWRNTASRLAPHIDTRADGGYVLVAPSVVNGKLYSWQEKRELNVSPRRLPEPPVWLIELLDAATNGSSSLAACDDTPANTIPEGQRNDTLARLAGWMRRAGMSATEILAALNRANLERCKPPLDAREVARIATSIGRYAPDAVTVALIEDHFAQDHRTPPANPLLLRELLAQCPMLRPPVIVGLLRRGETMNVIAPPKAGKSWLVLALAMAIATGRKWLDMFETVTGNVLILDNELHPETLAHRIPQVAERLQIGMNEIAETISVQSLRGQLRDIFSMRQYFESITPGRYALVVLDAFYRFMPRDMDENDNGTMANIYNHIDALADRLNCSFILIHHTTKGNQSMKSITDVGAGAGSQSRAADAHLILRPHEQPGAVVLEAAVRSWPPINPMALRWEFPVWRPAPDLDPRALRSERSRRTMSSPQDIAEMPGWSVERFIETFIHTEPTTLVELRERTAQDPTLPWRRVCDLLAVAEQRGLIWRLRLPGRGGPLGFVLAPAEGEL